MLVLYLVICQKVSLFVCDGSCFNSTSGHLNVRILSTYFDFSGNAKSVFFFSIFRAQVKSVA